MGAEDVAGPGHALEAVGHGELAEQKAMLAMAIHGDRRPRRHLARITTRHLLALAKRTNVPRAFAAFVELVEQVDGALENVQQRLPSDFPAHVLSSVTQGVRCQRDRFLRGLRQ